MSAAVSHVGWRGRAAVVAFALSALGVSFAAGYTADRLWGAGALARYLRFRGGRSAFTLCFGRGHDRISIWYRETPGTGMPLALIVCQPWNLRNAFGFSYYRHGGYFGVPEVMLSSGGDANRGAWTDVGVRGRLLLRGGLGFRRGCVRLHGRWIDPEGGIIDGTFEYHGVRYRYDKTSGGWDELSAPRSQKSQGTK